MAASLVRWTWFPSHPTLHVWRGHLVVNGTKTRFNHFYKVQQSTAEIQVEMKLGWVATRTVQSQPKSTPDQVPLAVH